MMGAEQKKSQQAPSPAQALEIARTIFGSRYAGASFAYVAGSIMRGEGTYLSDIDLVVIFDRIEAARRESFMAEGIPVEAFVHDLETLAWFVEDDISRGRPSILNMIAEGIAIGRASDDAENLRREISERLTVGPPPLSPATLNALRYEITDAVDDLMGQRGPGEIMAIGAMLYPRLVELALRGRGQWNGAGKWGPRLLRRADSSVADSFENAFRALFVSGNVDLVVALAQRELAPHGGSLFEGDCRSAPETWRVSRS